MIRERFVAERLSDIKSILLPNNKLIKFNQSELCWCDSSGELLISEKLEKYSENYFNSIENLKEILLNKPVLLILRDARIFSEEVLSVILGKTDDIIKDGFLATKLRLKQFLVYNASESKLCQTPECGDVYLNYKIVLLIQLNEEEFSYLNHEIRKNSKEFIHNIKFF